MTLCKCHCNDYTKKQAQDQKAPLAIVKSIIVNQQMFAVKNCGDIGKVDVMLMNVCASLRLIPFESHINCSYKM